jgi:hypothetical protein
VKRLLERLEFLSELPERLAEMIDNKYYIDAVKLYNKTISVLTRHSHVLSFKKIKERTELMMADLTEKVIDMLDDSSLEAVKVMHLFDFFSCSCHFSLSLICLLSFVVSCFLSSIRASPLSSSGSFLFVSVFVFLLPRPFPPLSMLSPCCWLVVSRS